MGTYRGPLFLWPIGGQNGGKWEQLENSTSSQNIRALTGF